MEATNRYSTPGLIDQARAEPWRFGFFQLVRLLKLHYSRTGRIDPENRPHQDPLRFRSLLSLNFPPSEISNLSFENQQNRSASDEPLSEIQVTFMGLVGPSGVLPRPYTELLINRHIEKRDDAAHAFLDLYSHRMTALFYEAWQKYRFHIEYERKGSSDFEQWLLHLVGFTPTTLKQNLNRQDDQGSLTRNLFSWFSGLMAQRPRNAGNLEAMLGYTFGQPCQVKSFSGRWIPLAPDQCTTLGRANACLGSSAVAGTRVRDYQSSFRVSFGPLTLAAYRELLPDTDTHRKLVRLLRFYAGIELDFEIELILKKSEIPAPQLGKAGTSSLNTLSLSTLSLGRLSWLTPADKPATEDGRAVFEITYDGATV
ncbi:type VI secretion system baseplate subunit TssG [Marinobacterium lutimaris]|uniref:Type VI secretion system protein ImpH n=1 Tax=Marinobacterium lutimaris TaxID=568106 RepID=A0A1H5UDA3_9GAMM|nr:type VI secretion system baseplate subunit TssG [Marinobacterium lutimaris]SEF73105.1 type VI secretion system protein ImpH [Marinobacterium lutimaris]